MVSLFLNFFLSTLVLVLTAAFVPEFEIGNVLAAVMAVFIVGMMNFLIRPVLVLLNIRITLWSLGLTSFVINALFLNVSTGLIDGFDLRSWQASVVAAMVLTSLQLGLHVLVRDKTLFNESELEP